MRYLTVLLFIIISQITPFVSGTSIKTDGIVVPEGKNITALVTELNSPKAITFDDNGKLIIAEDNNGNSQIVRLENGRKIIIADSATLGHKTVTAMTFLGGQLYLARGGTISVLKNKQSIEDLITGLPAGGDYGVNQIAAANNYLYIAIGTATNSGVVGEDNQSWVTKEGKDSSYDKSCYDIMLNDQVFESKNLLGNDPKTVKTTPFTQYGTALPHNATVKGSAKCNGAILRTKLDGSDLQVYTWGLRNPYGLQAGPDGSIYATVQGFENRGSRPVAGGVDCFYQITAGEWYGWPDFVCEEPITDPKFKPADGAQPQYLLGSHPTETPPKPILKFDHNNLMTGFAFASSSEWGKSTEALIAFAGDGVEKQPKIIKADVTSGQITDFIYNKTGAAGLIHPTQIIFGPDNILYVVDQGKGKDSGIIWQIAPKGYAAASREITAKIIKFDWHFSVAFIVFLAFTLGLLKIVRKSRKTVQPASLIMQYALISVLAEKKTKRSKKSNH